MADRTLILATELAVAPVIDDYFWIWDSSVAQLKRVSVANAISAFVTGGGVLATGGFTLTVPQSMIAAGRNVANTFSALQTFSSGIAFANETLSTYDQGTWTPAITGSSTNPTITYTSQVGIYTQIGNVVHYAFRIVINTVSGGTGNLQISLPSAPQTLGTVAPLRISGPDLAGTPATLVFVASTTGGANGNVVSCVDNGAETTEPVTILGDGDVLQASGIYFV